MTSVTHALLDAWVNLTTGVGDPTRDKRLGSTFADCYLSDTYLSNLYHGDALTYQVVAAYPAEALREGVEVHSDSDPETAERLTEAVMSPGFLDPYRLALDMGRLHGGALLYPVKDREFRVVEKPDVGSVGLDAWGRPESYSIFVGQVSATLRAADVVRVDGARTAPSKRRERQGWDLSELQRLEEILRDFGATWSGVLGMLADGSQGVFQMAGLHEALASEGNRDVVQARLRLLDKQRSSNRAIAIDKEDSFLNVERTFSGVADTLDRVMLLVSMATGIPVTVLMGRSPAGMNATGESDLAIWYGRVGQYRRDRAEPVLRRCLPWLAQWSGLRVPADVRVEWPSLLVTSPAEEAQTFATWATALGQASAAGIVEPEVAARKLRDLGDLPDVDGDLTADIEGALSSEGP